MMPGPCGFKGCTLARFHVSDCEPTHAGKLAYWGERALDIRASMERDGLSLDEVGKIFVGAAPTLRPPPMPSGHRGDPVAMADAGLDDALPHPQMPVVDTYTWREPDELEPRRGGGPVTEEQWTDPRKVTGQRPLALGPVCGAVQHFDAGWARVAPELNWDPLHCDLTPGHDGRHFDEATQIPWEPAR